MKIAAIINQTLNGVQFYRVVIPNSYMIRLNSDVHVHFTDTLLKMPDKELATFDMVHASYHNWDIAETPRLNDLGVKLVLDVDDFWKLSRFHELYDKYSDIDRTKQIIALMKKADAITTTTDTLADRIRPYNLNVGVFNNALMNDDYPKSKENKIPYFAWFGANNHTADLMMIQHIQKGFKVPVFIPEMYRLVFKDNFLYYPHQEIPDYLNLYTKFDVVLAPLRKDEFNSYKSALKVMEAGFFSKPLIISDVMPYSPYLKHKQNCLVVKKRSEWIKWVKLLSNDKEMRETLGKNLHDDVICDFDLDAITKERYVFYNKVLGKDITNE